MFGDLNFELGEHLEDHVERFIILGAHKIIKPKCMKALVSSGFEWIVLGWI